MSTTVCSTMHCYERAEAVGNDPAPFCPKCIRAREQRIKQASRAS